MPDRLKDPEAHSNHLLRAITEENLAARKISELEQQTEKMNGQLAAAHEALEASEERVRDLFDEAPIAYVTATYRF